MEAAGDRKKTLPSLICNLIMGGILMGFFGKYYWGNPDETYTVTNTDGGTDTVLLFCWTSETGASADQTEIQNY